MKNRLLLLVSTLLLGGALASCKKAEQATGSDSSSAADASSDSRSSSAAPPAGAENGVVLKVKWPVGNRYLYRMDLDQHSTNKFPGMPQPMQQDVVMAMTYALSVMKETSDGGRELEMEFIANEMEVKMGGQTMMSFDSKEKAPGDAQNPFVGPYQKMIGTKIKLVTDANGLVKEILDLEEWLDEISGEGPAKGMMAQQFNEGYFRQIADFGRGFPNRPVAIGETWPFKLDTPLGPMGKVTIDSKVTFKEWADHEQRKCVVLKTAGTMQGTPDPKAEPGPMGKMSIENGQMTSTTWFEPELGAMIETTGDQTMRMKGEMPGPPGNRGPGGFTSDVRQKITLKLVELGKTK